MEQSAYLGSAIAGLVYCALGARLLRLGCRGETAPERVLGLAFLAPARYRRRIEASAIPT